MTDVEVQWEQGDRFSVGIRGHRVVVDQPHVAGGDDLGPTPTELFVAGLAACVGFYAGRYLARHRLPADGLRVDCDFDMAEDRPARVEAIRLRLAVPASLSAQHRVTLQRVVEHCTVHNSLRMPPSVHIAIQEEQAAA